ncbi:uncharacterized protein LOC141594862 [Silene latifolia]|uniref:uncharacterized protein LOC141594862 n=1 Tax=Silene latifolia TaxID=37657 RepID=UPI003D7859F2
MDYFQSVGCDAEGLKGGLWVGWKSSCKLECKGSLWYLCCVYGEPNHTKRGVVWESFTNLLNSLDKPFLLIGDFNQVEYSSDKLEGDNLTRGADLFSYWKNTICLMDIPFKGPRFTWCNNRESPHRIYERLDKVFASNDWLFIFPNTFIKHLPIQISDHAPIILCTNMVLYTKKKVYRLETWCFDYAECNSLIKERWEKNDNGDDSQEIGGLFLKHFSTIFKSNVEPECFDNYMCNYGYLFDNLKRPDGIPAAFYQKYWAIVKKDVINDALNILNSGNVIKDFNKTFIVLIPKNDCPERVGDFRPINLCNVIMKVVTKCIANRIKGIMDDLVGPFQSAFVPNRSIADNIVIAQEILHVINHRNYGKEGLMTVKANMSKAYGTLNWNFIRGVLSSLNLSGSMVHLIMSTIETVTYDILINGAPMEKFEPRCGIRQGDPLSPYIFALCTEVLSQMILYAQDGTFIKSIKICKNGPDISHLLFADDSFFFIRGDYGDLDFLMNIIDEYCVASRQCINKDKSSILFSRNCSLMTVKKCLAEYKFVPKHDLGNYLGLPTSIGSSKRDLFKFLVAKPNAGYPLGIIFFSLRLFWWSGTRINKSIHWCSQDFVSRPVGEGGLGLRNIGCFNQALLAKSAWRILSVPRSLISKVIGPKLGMQNDPLFQNQWKTPQASSWALKSFIWGSDLIYNNIAWTIGAPYRVNAWTSRWIESYSLRDLSGDFIDAPTNATFLVDDSFYWKLSKHGDFAVKSGYYAAAKGLSIGSNSVADRSRMSAFCKSKLWQLPISIKLRVFLWKFMANALPVGSEFLKRNMHWRSTCSLCEGSSPCVESISHLFRDFSFAKALWFGCPLGLRLTDWVDIDVRDWCMNDVVCSKSTCLIQAPLVDISPDFVLAKRIRNSFPFWIVGGPDCGNVCTVKCDAAWREDRSSGMGWCLLDGNGTLRTIAHARTFASSALHAEGHATIMALKWALDEGYLHIRLVTDCLILVMQVAEAEKAIASISCIIQDLKSTASRFHCCSLSYCPRRVNRIAHNLAQKALL